MKENAKENELVKKLTNKHYTITTAESCTGGLLSATIINVSGASDVINCAYVTYANEAKENLVLSTSPLKKAQAIYRTSNCDVFAVESRPEDIVYFDPPYTKRQYASYYHILETIVCGDQPEVTGVSGLRPWKDKASVFCYKTKALNALSELILKQRANRVILSYSN